MTITQSAIVSLNVYTAVVFKKKRNETSIETNKMQQM
jgi:hypothetical protein